MLTNRRRRRISPQQLSLLYELRERPKPAIYLGWSDYGGAYALTAEARAASVRSVKRALRALESWGLVKLSEAPHPDADMTWGDYMPARGPGKRFPNHYTIAQVRAEMHGHIAPSGNRRQPIIWAEITGAGRAIVTASNAK